MKIECTTCRMGYVFVAEVDGENVAAGVTFADMARARAAGTEVALATDALAKAVASKLSAQVERALTEYSRARSE